MTNTTDALIVGLNFPVDIWIFNLAFFRKAWPNAGGRMPLYWFIAVLVGFSIDDVCTSVGMQAEEVPRNAHEGNESMVGFWKWIMDKGWADTETAAHRLVGLWFLSIILLAQYYRWFSNWYLIFFMVGIAALKAYSGYDWCNIKPNAYTFSDYLKFKPGRKTPERHSLEAITAYNASMGLHRRLAETEPIGPQLMDLVYFLQPGV